jgi:hypothetical protein
MKSFKNIVIAAVAATALTAIVATPASAATTALSVNGTSVATGTALATPVVLPVPADNSVDAADAVKFAVTGLDTGSVVSAVANGVTIVPALATVSAPVTSANGAASISINTGTGTTAEFYVYTKSVSTGTVVVTIGGNTTTYYVKGTAAAAYNLSVATPDSVNLSTVTKVYAKTTDVFGNPVVTTTPTITAINATVSSVSVYDTATGTFAFDLTAPAAVGTTALAIAISATDVAGLPAAAKSVNKFVAVSNPADVLASVKAELAATQAALAAEKAAHEATKASLAKSVADAKAAADKATADAAAVKTASDKSIADLKAAFNALAKKWNVKNPKAKVTLVK